MDQSIGLNLADRRRAVENLSRFVASSVQAGRASDAPFYHLVFDRIFPDDVYNAMLTAMPLAPDYRPMSGRSKGHDLADGTHTRVKIDLFPEYVRGLPAEKRAVWDVVGRALCSNDVKQAFVARLAPGLRRRFGTDFGKVGMYPIVTRSRRIPIRAGRGSPSSSTCRMTTARRISAPSFTSGCPTAACPSARR